MKTNSNFEEDDFQPKNTPRRVNLKVDKKVKKFKYNN